MAEKFVILKDKHGNDIKVPTKEATKAIVDTKVSTTAAFNKLYGTDETGAQVTYDVSGIGTIKGVQLNGVDLIPDANSKVNVNGVLELDSNSHQEVLGDIKFSGVTKVATAGKLEVDASIAASLGYVKAAIAASELTHAVWLPAVKSHDLLPTPSDVSKVYLCRVMESVEALDPQGVYQRVAGASSNWTLFSDENEFVNEIELASAISVETYRATTAETLVKSSIQDHLNNEANPHAITKAQVGLGNVDNTSDLLKPISTATQAALDDLVKSVNGATVAGSTTITVTTKSGIASNITGIAPSTSPTLTGVVTTTDVILSSAKTTPITDLNASNIKYATEKQVFDAITFDTSDENW